MPTLTEIYLDSNSIAPTHPEVIEWVKGQASTFANPSSQHAPGRRSRAIVDQARSDLSSLIGAPNYGKLVFTSSGSESNQWVVRALAEEARLHGRPFHWVLSEGEHASLLSLIPWIEKSGGKVTRIPLLASGEIDVFTTEAALSERPTLLSLHWVNNETGVIQPVQAIAGLAKKTGCLFHLDSAQALGKLPINLKEGGVHFASFSGHKIGAFSGVGALWISPEVASMESLIPGAQEFGLRGGSHNVIGIGSFGIAARHRDIEAWNAKVLPLRNELEERIHAKIWNAQIHGEKAPRVSNTTSLGFLDLSDPSIVQALDLQGISVSAGSACSSGFRKPSHVLLAMGLNHDQALSSVRVSLSMENTREEIHLFIARLETLLDRIRRVSVERFLESP